MKEIKIAVIGFGGRGSIYSHHFNSYQGVQIVAVCDINDKRLNYAKELYNLSDEMLFNSENKFFMKGKLADLCIVASQDKQHVTHSIKAMRAGYDLLLEKPIATSVKDCKKILSVAKKLRRKIYVCHVLRYTPFFASIKKELSSGDYGKAVTFNLTENVGYWHYAHSYVRGSWNNSKVASPMIIAKSCHDLDIINWLLDDRCVSISSYGSNTFFNKSNFPEGASQKCFDCKYNSECDFSAERIYLDLPHKPFGLRTGNSVWPSGAVTHKPTEETLISALKNGTYGRCVFACDNDVVDHQVVDMLYGNDITAHLTMTAFSVDCHRDIHIYCTHGEIYGDTKNGKVVCKKFSGEVKELETANEITAKYGHNGGDYLLIKDIVDILRGGDALGLTSIDKSFDSHLMGFAAEKSRLSDGKAVKL